VTELAGEGPIRESYDVDGLRIEREGEGRAERYQYSDGRMLATTNGMNAVTRRLRYAGLGRRVLGPALGLVLGFSAGSAEGYQAHLDALGSPLALTRTDGAVAERTRYGVWGEVEARATTDTALASNPNPLTWQGYVADADAGGASASDGATTYYAYQRHYQVGVGRFTSRDPWAGDPTHPITQNEYLGLNANPLRYVDPDGRIAYLSDWEAYTDDTVAGYDRDIDRAVADGASGRAFALGVGKGFASLGNMVVSGLNTTSNLLARNIYDGATYEQAQREIAANELAMANAMEATHRTAVVIEEDPGGAVRAVHGAAVGFTVDVAMGDPRAMAGLGEFTGQLVVPAGTAKGLKFAGESVDTARAAMRMGDGFIDAGMADDLAAMSRGGGRVPDALPHNEGPRPPLGVGDPPQRYQGPWTQRDLARAAQGMGPLDLVPRVNRRGREVPLELHHADQMPGSAIHEVDVVEHRQPGVHGQPRQGVTGRMRKEDAQLHWQLRGQEMGNQPPPHE
jgi:RHS repeat-associated protein